MPEDKEKTREQGMEVSSPKGFRGRIRTFFKKLESNKEKEPDPFDLDKEYPEFKGWEAIGFHRPLGRELWQIIVEQINNALYLFIMLYMIPIIQPFPEIAGYNGVAGGLFSIFYVIFDTGTNFGIARFIAEYRIKDLKRMLEYVSFFIRYQMLTGLIQVTLLSWYTFEIIVNTNYAYLTWMLIIILQKQWPGMLGIFKTVLQGFQHHAKVEMLNLLQGQIVERITLVGFVIVGRVWGESNPAIGMMMGIVIFTHIGNYIDDLIFGLISAHYVNKILKKYMGMTLGQAFRMKISKPVLNEMIFYGVQGSLLPILSTWVGTMTLLAYTSEISGYITWSALVGYGSMFSGIVSQFGDFALGTSIAESYSNDKKELAEFYISYSLRWRYFFYLLVATVMFAVIPYFIYIIENFDVLSYYAGTTSIFIPLLLKRLIDPVTQLPDSIMYGTQKITQNNIVRAIEEVLKIFFLYLLVYWLRIQDSWGLWGIILLIGYQHYFAYIIKTIILYVYINKRVMKTKLYVKATFLGPLVAALPIYGITQAWYYTGFGPLTNAVGIELSITISMLMAFVILLFIYFPLNVIAGGWDDFMFSTFKKAIDLSGPSKPIFLILYQIMKPCKKFAEKLGTFNHPSLTIPYDTAFQQMKELMDIKRETMNQST